MEATNAALSETGITTEQFQAEVKKLAGDLSECLNMQDQQNNNKQVELPEATNPHCSQNPRRSPQGEACRASARVAR